MTVEKSIIGHYRIDEPTEMSEAQEVASWYRRGIVQPGLYPVTSTSDFRWKNWAWIRFPGIISASNFTSRLGAHHGAPKIDEEVGEEHTFVSQRYMYQIIDDPRFTPVDGWCRGSEFKLGDHMRQTTGSMLFRLVGEEKNHFRLQRVEKRDGKLIDVETPPWMDRDSLSKTAGAFKVESP